LVSPFAFLRYFVLNAPLRVLEPDVAHVERPAALPFICRRGKLRSTIASGCSFLCGSAEFFCDGTVQSATRGAAHVFLTFLNKERSVSGMRCDWGKPITLSWLTRGVILEISMSFSIARVAVCSVLGVVGIYAGVVFARFIRSDPDTRAAVSPARQAQIQLPDPRLSPADVVRLQVEALRAFRDDQSAIHQCYVLASPANRAVTGPLERFTAMVQNPTYRALVEHTTALVGRPVIRGRQATVLVTLLDRQRDAHIFRFFLSKQTDAALLDCWMTDAVIPAQEPFPPEHDRAGPSGSAA
jgi:hypothetical protein